MVDTHTTHKVRISNFQNLNCLQINLHHSKLASASLSQVILDLSLDVILIQEPYAFTGHPPTLANVPAGFSAYHDLSSDHAYGSAIIVRDSVAKAGSLTTKHISNHVACIELHTSTSIYRFASVYLRPSLPDFCAVALNLFTQLSSANTIIGVDSNAKNTVWSSCCTDRKGSYLESILLQLQLNIANIHIDQLDFVPGGTSFVDLTLVGDIVDVKRWLFLSMPSLSDHPYIYFELRLPQLPTMKRPALSPITIPRLQNIDQNRFCRLLDSAVDTLISPSLSSITACELSHHVNSLTSTIQQCAIDSRVAVPFSRHSRNMPWWSTFLCSLRSKSRRAFKVWSDSTTEANRILFRESKSLYQRELRKAKSKSWAHFRASTSTSDTFKFLSTLSGKSKTINLPTSILIDGRLSSDPSIIAKGCADHFFPTSLPSISPIHQGIEDEVASLLSSDSYDKAPPISEWEFDGAVAALNPHSAPGSDGLTADLVLLSIPHIKRYFILVLNACLLLCVFPDKWKVAKVNIIGKLNKLIYQSLDSFRPISLVSNLSKILEKIILNRLSWYARSNGWFSPNQHGFTEGKSTESAIHSLVSYIESGFVMKRVTACAFLDIKSAFDSAWHPAIILALKKRSCPLYLVKIISSFLTDRTALINPHGAPFSKTISLGCPQGGVLSPFLWNILVDDVLRISMPFPIKFVAYADDLTIATSHKDAAICTQNLQHACDRIDAWLKGVRLNLNAIKTVLVVFSRKRFDHSLLHLTVNGNHISPSNDVNFLGLRLDQNLKWSAHVAAKCVSAKRAIFMVNNCLRLTWGFDPSRLRFLYLAAVEPIITYGCSVWSSFLRTKSGVKKLRSLQRSITVLITRSMKSASSEALLILSNLLPLDLRVIQLSALRFLSSQDSLFSPSSLNFISARIPAITSALKTDLKTTPFSRWHPPWLISFDLLQIVASDFVSLCPCSSNTLRFFAVCTKQLESTRFGFVATDCRGVLDIWTGLCLPTASLNELMSLSFKEILAYAHRKSCSYAVIEIFVRSRSSLSFTKPASDHSTLDSKNFSDLLSLKAKVSLFHGISEQDPGPLLANFWATAANRPDNYSIPTSHAAAKSFIGACIRNIWELEWANSLAGAVTRSFFPSPQSALVLLSRRPHSFVTQILTGHSVLNDHQYRFNFIRKPSCKCGCESESVPHFLFHCPIYDLLRSDFISLVRHEKISWPPSPELISRNKLLWDEFVRFILKSKRVYRP